MVEKEKPSKKNKALIILYIIMGVFSLAIPMVLFIINLISLFFFFIIILCEIIVLIIVFIVYFFVIKKINLKKDEKIDEKELDVDIIIEKAKDIWWNDYIQPINIRFFSSNEGASATPVLIIRSDDELDLNKRFYLFFSRGKLKSFDEDLSQELINKMKEELGEKKILITRKGLRRVSPETGMMVEELEEKQEEQRGSKEKEEGEKI